MVPLLNYLLNLIAILQEQRYVGSYRHFWVQVFSFIFVNKSNKVKTPSIYVMPGEGCGLVDSIRPPR